MKKRKASSLLLTTALLFAISACNDNAPTNSANSGNNSSSFNSANSGNDNQNGDYQQVITCLEANELDKAVDYCSKLSDNALTLGKEAIFDIIVEDLNDLLDSSASWCINAQDGIVDEEIIYDFKNYQQLLTLIKITNSDFTNTLTFTNSVLSLEQYIPWNDFYISQIGDTYISEALDYIITARDYSTDTMRQYYYGLAYNRMNSAYTIYKNKPSTSKGMKEVTNYCYSWVNALNQWQYGNDAIRDTSYDAAFNNAFDEFDVATDIVFATIKSWPSKIY